MIYLMNEIIIVDLCKKCDAKRASGGVSSNDLCKKCRKSIDKVLNDEFIGFMRSSLNDKHMDLLKDVLKTCKPSFEYPITMQ